MKKMLQLYVHDRPGVLDRVVGLIRRWGWNIGSLTAGDIGGGLTQIMLLLEGRDIKLDALGESLDEMDAVRAWHALTEDENPMREMVLFRVCADDPLGRREGVRVVRAVEGIRFCEYTGLPSAADTLVAALYARDIPCVRSGPMAYVTHEGRELP